MSHFDRNIKEKAESIILEIQIYAIIRRFFLSPKHANRKV